MMRGLDVETTALDPADGRLSLVQVADPDTFTVRGYDVIQEDTLSIPSEAVSHNAVFEERWLRAAGHDAQFEDTMIASQVFYTGTNAARSKQFSHSLQAAVKRELHRELSKEEQDSDWSTLALTREQLKYAARDAHVPPELAGRKAAGQAGAGGARRGIRARAQGLPRRRRHAEERFRRNEAKLDPLVEEVTEQAERLKAELEEEWGINPGSSKQLREYFELDKIEGWPKTPAGAPKTDQDAMRTLADTDPSVAKWVEWKEVEKIRSTYGKSLRDKLMPEGRVHARFKPFGTATGRFSSSTPNLQNIPKRGELGPRIRGLFWSGAEDRVLIKADYASIELWVAAILWDDPHMQHALQQGVNMHVATAAALFNVKPGEVTKEQNSRTHHERFPGLDRALKALLRDMPNTPCWSVVGQVRGFKVF